MSDDFISGILSDESSNHNRVVAASSPGSQHHSPQGRVSSSRNFGSSRNLGSQRNLVSPSSSVGRPSSAFPGSPPSEPLASEGKSLLGATESQEEKSTRSSEKSDRSSVSLRQPSTPGASSSASVSSSNNRRMKSSSPGVPPSRTQSYVSTSSLTGLGPSSSSNTKRGAGKGGAAGDGTESNSSYGPFSSNGEGSLADALQTLRQANERYHQQKEEEKKDLSYFSQAGTSSFAGSDAVSDDPSSRSLLGVRNASSWTANSASGSAGSFSTRNNRRNVKDGSSTTSGSPPSNRPTSSVNGGGGGYGSTTDIRSSSSIPQHEDPLDYDDIDGGPIGGGDGRRKGGGYGSTGSTSRRKQHSNATNASPVAPLIKPDKGDRIEKAHSYDYIDSLPDSPHGPGPGFEQDPRGRLSGSQATTNEYRSFAEYEGGGWDGEEGEEESPNSPFVQSSNKKKRKPKMDEVLDLLTPYALLFINFMLNVSSILLMMAGFVTKENSAIALCDRCSKLSIGPIVVGGFMWVSSMYGFNWIRTKNILVLLGYAASLVLCTISLMFMLGAAAVFDRQNYKESHLMDNWQLAVQEDPDSLCLLQLRFNCSGYGLGCCRTKSTEAFNPLSKDNRTDIGYCFGPGSPSDPEMYPSSSSSSAAAAAGGSGETFLGGLFSPSPASLLTHRRTLEAPAIPDYAFKVCPKCPYLQINNTNVCTDVVYRTMRRNLVGFSTILALATTLILLGLGMAIVVRKHRNARYRIAPEGGAGLAATATTKESSPAPKPWYSPIDGGDGGNDIDGYGDSNAGDC